MLNINQNSNITSKNFTKKFQKNLYLKFFLFFQKNLFINSNKFAFLSSIVLHIFIFTLIFINLHKDENPQNIVKIAIINHSQSANKLTKSINHNKFNIANQSTSSKNSNNQKNNSYVEPIFDAKYLNNPIPNYPINARSRGIEGKVLLQVLVSKTGEPLKIIIYSSSGSNILDESAFETVSNWRFVPAMQADQAIEAVVIVPIEFKLS